ncbi:type II toxin-antitoxin system PemK/MazF family toxin [Halobacteriaceae archaeon SHR40]|uniref:type II toxin-antitoxin system PemK/MazF family toxin n=1 Tax=Halovenus amylolytica TaxID=2500550 RepID=UPI000FE338D3
MKIRRGDIVSVDLGGPADDDTRGGEIYKTRPAVVIQNDIGNKNSPTTIIAPISGGHTNYPFHVNLPGSMDELTKDSHVQLDQIRTVDITERIEDKYGNVSSSQMSEIEDAIRISLGL